MWDLPRPGLKPVSAALAGRFSTTAPPGKPLCTRFESLKRQNKTTQQQKNPPETHIKQGYVLIGWWNCDQRLPGTQPWILRRNKWFSFTNSVFVVTLFTEHNYCEQWESTYIQCPNFKCTAWWLYHFFDDFLHMDTSCNHHADEHQLIEHFQYPKCPPIPLPHLPSSCNHDTKF